MSYTTINMDVNIYRYIDIYVFHYICSISFCVRSNSCKGGTSFLQHYKVLIDPIVAAYPELKLDTQKFRIVPRMYHFISFLTLFCFF